MRSYRLTLAGILLVSVLVCTGGCDDPEQVSYGTVFYPPAPDPPRIQFLMSFSDLEKWSRSGSSFSDFIVGDTDDSSTEIKAPYGIAARDGKIYICDVGLGKLHVIDMVNKDYGQLGEPGQLRKPVNITIAPDGTKYVCDTMVRQVAIFDANDQYVRHIGDPSSCNPIDLAILGNELIIADIADSEVEVWSMDGELLRHIARKGSGPGQLRLPTNLEVSPDGQIFVTDTASSIVNVYDPQGNYTRSVGAPGDRPGFFARPKGITIDSEGIIYVADSQWERIQVFEPQGRLLMAFGGASTRPEGMGMPAGLATDATSLSAFSQYLEDDFEPTYLLLLANQFGLNKISIYAYGRSRTATYPEIEMTTATRPPASPSERTQPSDSEDEE
jgi:sugar lactone lactonase YvrE